jgi:hypothetical protein
MLTCDIDNIYTLGISRQIPSRMVKREDIVREPIRRLGDALNKL